jgi:hypothetical protein
MSPASPLPDSDARGRSVEKGRSVLGRLRSKSRSGQRPTPPEDRKPAPATRERRFSISDRISSVLKRKPKAEQETPPPLPTSSRVKVSASSTKLAVQGTPQRTLARSASSPNLSRKQSWQIESRLPPLPAFGEAFTLGALTYTSPTLPSSFHTPPTIDTSVRRPIDVEPDSPSSVPSLSPSSSQSVSFGASSQSNLHTPSLPSPTSFPANATDSPDRDEVLHHFYPFGSPLAPLEESVYGQPMSLTATPQGMEMQSGRGSTFDSPRTGASDDMPLAMLKQRREAAAASRPAPFQFVSAEVWAPDDCSPALLTHIAQMSKKPLKKGRSTPNLRAEPFRRPPSIPATPYLGHSLLPQSDDGVKARVGAARPLPVFVEQSVLALAT